MSYSCIEDRKGCLETYPHGHCCFCDQPCHQYSQACGRCPRNWIMYGTFFPIFPQPVRRKSERLSSKTPIDYRSFNEKGK